MPPPSFRMADLKAATVPDPVPRPRPPTARQQVGVRALLLR